MGEEVAGVPEDPAVAGSASERVVTGVPPEAIGSYLARQRRLRGIGLDELARITCIPLRSLERLESGAFDHTPDGFARGFVRTVANAMGLDPDDTVSRMLPEVRPGLRRRRPPLPEPNPWLGGILGTLVLVAVGIVLLQWISGSRLGDGRRGPPIIRRDAVRELARSEGLLARFGADETPTAAPATVLAAASGEVSATPKERLGAPASPTSVATPDPAADAPRVPAGDLGDAFSTAGAEHRDPAHATP